MIVKIDHVAVAVRGLEARLPFWAEALGLDVQSIETVDSEKVKVAFLPVGGARIELLEPTGPDSAVAGFLERRGEGLHHVTFAVDDLQAALTRLGERGIDVIGGGSRPGAEGSKVAFLHPKSTGGVLVELVERRSGSSSSTSDIGPGSPVLLYLREPQEKLWGVLRRLDPSGVALWGIDLASFDDWVAQIEGGEETVVGPSVLFLPMTRVERILLDRSSGELPSLAERFRQRSGRDIDSVMLDEGLA